MLLAQSIDQAADVSDWRKDEEYGEYPEGARDKTLVYCPSPAPYGFLKEEHRYLFKRSSPRYAEQFWGRFLRIVWALRWMCLYRQRLLLMIVKSSNQAH